MIDRRSVISAALGAIAAVSSSRQSLAQAGMSRITAYGFSFPGLAGGDIRLSEFAGKPILIVNTASLCGFTPQYGGLQELWTEFHSRGLMIIGVPSNDFGGQEPGGAAEALGMEFADLVQFGKVTRDWFTAYAARLAPTNAPFGTRVGQELPANPAPALDLTAYAGTYANDYWGPARVTEAGGRLALALGPKLVVPLEHWNGNTFTFSMVTENSPPGSISKATFDGDKLTLEYYDTAGNGVFTR